LPHVLLIKFDTRHEGISELLERYGLKRDTKLSESLGEYGYFRIQHPLEESSIELRSRLLKESHEIVRDVRFEITPMFVPLTYIPNDEMYPYQWNIKRIGAGSRRTLGKGASARSYHSAWNFTRGDPSVVICIIDKGCDLGHPDLKFVSNGFNTSGSGDGSPVPTPIGYTSYIGEAHKAHGTLCAGVAAATIDNKIGVAGVAGGCMILPVAVPVWTSFHIGTAIW
jgi:subtilisin family serine protease